MLDTSVIKFNEKGLVPAVAQDASTGEVLMLAWMNAEALTKTVSTGKAHYFSRSRNSLWLKGETSGNFQEVKSVLYDCDADTVLLVVEPKGPACHTGERTCFYRALSGPEGARADAGPAVIKELYRILEERKGASTEKSYVASLYAKGLPKISAKITEEAAELIEAAEKKTDSDVVYELCDLWFHTLVLMAHRGIPVEKVFVELKRRFGTSGIEEKMSRGQGKGRG